MFDCLMCCSNFLLLDIIVGFSFQNLFYVFNLKEVSLTLEIWKGDLQSKRQDSLILVI